MIQNEQTNVENWNVLTDTDELSEVMEMSEERLQFIYKHSPTCSICHEAKEEIESIADEIRAQADLNYINVVEARSVSNAIAKMLDVRHESPQLLLVDHHKCVWDESHFAVKADEIREALEELA